MTGEGPIKPGRKPVSKESKAALKKFAKTVKSRSTKKKSGGGHTPDHLSQVAGVEESWNLVNSLLNNSAPIDLGPPRQVGGKRKSRRYHYLSGGGEESSGATFLPAQWNTPNAPLPRGNDPSQIQSAYGRINAVSGMDVNLAAFPNSSMQQTGGRPKKNKANKPKKDDVPKEKPAKKGKKSSKKETSLWEKIKSFF
jgi:hypothetical protein